MSAAAAGGEVAFESAQALRHSYDLNDSYTNSRRL